MTSGLFRHEPVYREYLRQVLRGCVEDEISYVEIRVNFFSALRFFFIIYAVSNRKILTTP